MARKIQGIVTREYLENAPLPQHAASYTCIPHKFVVDNTKQLLLSNNFHIETELYKCNLNAEIAQGMYYIKDKNTTNTDLDISMMFAWANSYDKSMRFKCSVGARVMANGCSIIAGDVANWGRIHKGTADKDTVLAIADQIKNAHRYFSDLVSDKKSMKDEVVTEEYQAELLGSLYAFKEYLTIEQVAIVKKEMKKPSHDYGVDKNSLWAFYNAILMAVKGSHPKNWLDRQRNIHWFLCRRFGIGNYINVTTHVSVPSPLVPGTGTATTTTGNINFSLDLPEVKQIDLEDMIKEVQEEKTIDMNPIVLAMLEEDEAPWHDVETQETLDKMNLENMDNTEGPVVTHMTESGIVLGTEEVKLPHGITAIGPKHTSEDGLQSAQAVLIDLSVGLNTDDEAPKSVEPVDPEDITDTEEIDNLEAKREEFIQSEFTTEEQAQIDANIKLLNSTSFEL